MKAILVMVVMALGPLSGCADQGKFVQSARQPLIDNLHSQRMMVLSNPPRIVADGREGLAVAARIAASANSTELSQRESARWVGVDSLPFLTSSDTGRQFLSAPFPRALARGKPAESCPVSAVATGTPEMPSYAIASQALENCLAMITPAQSDCGCEIVALDDLVTVPRESIAYATGTTARMRSSSLGIDLLLVAEETTPGETLLRDLRGPLARLESGDADAVTLVFLKTGRQFEGRRIAVGFRRGRVAQRIYAVDADGNHLSLLIGFEPDEIAGGVGAWLAWPPNG
jgi:hypothetical protein